MNLHSCTYRCPVTDVTLADVLLGAGIGAAGTAGIDALTGQPVTWKGEATGAALGGAGGVLAGGFGAGAAPGAGAAGGNAGVSAAGAAASAGPAIDPAPFNAAAMGTDALGVTGGIPAAADTGLAGSTSEMLPEVTVNAARTASLDPSLLYAAGGPTDINPAAFTGGVNPADITGPSSVGATTDPSAGYSLPADIAFSGTSVPSIDTSVPATFGSDMTGYGLSSAGAGGADSGFLDQLFKYFKTPRGALTLAGLGANLYGILGKTSLPGAAKTALNAAGPAVQQAQATISTGGYGAPQWIQQKSAIDAQINEQIAQATRALQQNAQSGGMGGANSAAVQQQIATLTSQFETQRQTLYAQALQMNVNNAVSELTGGNATLMAIAQLQQEQERWAADLARSISGTTGQLATLYPTTSPQSASA